MAKITLFAQILQYLPKEETRKIIRRHGMDKHSKGCDTWTQLVSTIFCQFADCVSLRDTANGMRSAMGNLNHLGVEKAPSKKGADNTSAWNVRVTPRSIVVADRAPSSTPL